MRSWSEPLLVAHTTLLENSCHGSFFIFPILFDEKQHIFSTGKCKISKKDTYINKMEMICLLCILLQTSEQQTLKKFNEINKCLDIFKHNITIRFLCI